jgi:hypothetical protein
MRVREYRRDAPLRAGPACLAGFQAALGEPGSHLVRNSERFYCFQTRS